MMMTPESDQPLASHSPEAFIGRRVISIADLLEKYDQNPLTGLANSVWLSENLPKILKGNQGNVSLLVLDLDGLKRINDEHGHQAGDNYLKQTAISLRDTTKDDPKYPDRTGDTVVHISGDEFVVILPGVSNEAAMQTVTEKYQQGLQAVGIEASIGGVIHLSEESSEELIARADEAMLNTKGLKKLEALTPEGLEDFKLIREIARKRGIPLRDLPAIDAALTRRDRLS